MSSIAYTVVFEAVVTGVTGSGSPGDVLVLSSSGNMVLSTTANRGSLRSAGVALTPYVNNSVVSYQGFGVIDATTAGLGAGTASWVRVSATGTLERCTPSGSDDVCGRVETDGTFHACFGFLTAAIVNGTGGGGGATLPIDLSAGPGTVVNQLPIGNQAPQTMAGDVTGTTAASVVAKVNGATVPAAGALTTGNAAYVSGVSALTYSALNLAGGSGWVTGALPLGNQAAPTGTGLAKVSAGAWVGAAALLVDADVNAAAAIAGTKISPNFGAQSVVTTADVSIGTNPSGTLGTSYGLRLANAVGIGARNATNNGDYAVMELANDNVLRFGYGGGSGNAPPAYVFHGSGSGTFGFYNSSYKFYASSTTFEVGVPIIGNAGASSPWSVHGRCPVHALGNNTTYTVTAAEYSFQVLQFSSTTATLVTITLPDPVDEAHSYFKDVDVRQCNVSQAQTFKAGAGTRTANTTGGGAGVPGVPLRIFVSPGCVDLAPG